VRPWLICAGVVAVGVAGVFATNLNTAGCVFAAEHRAHWISEARLCPPFVEMRPVDVVSSFEANVRVGDDAKVVEANLESLELAFTWDAYSGRYQAIRRHPVSNFHAVVVAVYLDEQGRYTRVDAYDSFTAL
jgi:hypothetical protein